MNVCREEGGGIKRQTEREKGKLSNAFLVQNNKHLLNICVTRNERNSIFNNLPGSLRVEHAIDTETYKSTHVYLFSFVYPYSDLYLKSCITNLVKLIAVCSNTRSELRTVPLELQRQPGLFILRLSIAYTYLSLLSDLMFAFTFINATDIVVVVVISFT